MNLEDNRASENYTIETNDHQGTDDQIQKITRDSCRSPQKSLNWVIEPATQVLWVYAAITVRRVTRWQSRYCRLFGSTPTTTLCVKLCANVNLSGFSYYRQNYQTWNSEELTVVKPAVVLAAEVLGEQQGAGGHAAATRADGGLEEADLAALEHRPDVHLVQNELGVRVDQAGVGYVHRLRDVPLFPWTEQRLVAARRVRKRASAPWAAGPVWPRKAAAPRASISWNLADCMLASTSSYEATRCGLNLALNGRLLDEEAWMNGVHELRAPGMSRAGNHRELAGDRAPLVEPLEQAAVEQRDALVAEQLEHEPDARAGHQAGAVRVGVVDDDVVVVAHVQRLGHVAAW